MFKWGVENELVTPGVLPALQAVAGLRRGKMEAPDPEPVRPVPEEHIRPVLDRVSRQVAAMIQVQILTRMRPGEVLQMRTCDLDLNEDDPKLIITAWITDSPVEYVKLELKDTRLLRS